jgi:hypothetical protein
VGARVGHGQDDYILSIRSDVVEVVHTPTSQKKIQKNKKFGQIRSLRFCFISRVVAMMFNVLELQTTIITTIATDSFSIIDF